MTNELTAPIPILSWVRNKIMDIKSTHENINNNKLLAAYQREAVRRFNIEAFDDKYYITFDGVRISCLEDNKISLLDRLDEIRQNYIDDKFNNYQKS